LQHLTFAVHFAAVFYGLIHFARAKGYHWAWGFLGLLSFVGWIILVCLPDRSDKDYREFQKRQVKYCPLCEVSQQTTTVSCPHCGFDFSNPKTEDEPQVAPRRKNGHRLKVGHHEDWATLLREYDECCRKGEYRKAVKLAQKALKLNPRAPEAWSMMGSSCETLGDEMEAAGNFDKADDYHRMAGEAWREVKRADPRILRPGYYA
jgi:tetratricopeptide (TPR) repeat protein